MELSPAAMASIFKSLHQRLVLFLHRGIICCLSRIFDVGCAIDAGYCRHPLDRGSHRPRCPLGSCVCDFLVRVTTTVNCGSQQSYFQPIGYIQLTHSGGVWKCVPHWFLFSAKMSLYDDLLWCDMNYTTLLSNRVHVILHQEFPFTLAHVVMKTVSHTTLVPNGSRSIEYQHKIGI